MKSVGSWFSLDEVMSCQASEGVYSSGLVDPLI